MCRELLDFLPLGLVFQALGVGHKTRAGAQDDFDNLQSVVEFDLPAGEYSAVVYHDLNGNGKLDTWFYGKPKEPYGFSNNARSAFGIPSFEESRFVVNSAETRLIITVK